jgi:hypothetical protein
MRKGPYADHDGGDDDHRHRVDHRRLDLGDELDVLLDVGRESLQDRVEDTASLAGLDHVGEESVERTRMLAHALGQRHAALDVLTNLENGRREPLVRLLPPEDVEALHQGQARVDHHAELPREDRETLGRHLAAGPGHGAPGLGLDRIDPRNQDLLAAQRRDSGLDRIGLPLAADVLACACPSRECECLHQFTLYSRPSALGPGPSSTHRPSAVPIAAPACPPGCGSTRHRARCRCRAESFPAVLPSSTTPTSPFRA